MKIPVVKHLVNDFDTFGGSGNDTLNGDTVGNNTLSNGSGNASFTYSIYNTFNSSDLGCDSNQAFIVYSQGTGDLFYNQNGALADLGRGDEFTTLTNNPLLEVTDFVI